MTCRCCATSAPSAPTTRERRACHGTDTTCWQPRRGRERAGAASYRQARHDRTGRDTARPPGPRGAEAVRTLARFAAGRPLEACADLFARYGDTVYLPVRLPSAIEPATIDIITRT
ncbi:MAG: hypothetical protein ACRDNT_23115 [Streptosporangiaceae bacterium]